MRSGKQEGFTYMTLLLIFAVMGMGLAATGELWSRSAKREREKELLFVGAQYREAIALYYNRSPGLGKRYPQALEDLLQDKRHPTVQRYLRRLYRDPLTGKSEWGIVKAPEGGIMGVYSLATGAPLKSGNFRGVDRSFNDASSYGEWKFVFVPSGTAPSQISMQK
jgi:type II secretory pathway pseudopilin PulG